MPRRTVDNSDLERWRSLPSTLVLSGLADHTKQDQAFEPTKSSGTSRWHATAQGRDFEILCTREKFFDTRASVGGGGAIDLAMHLLSLDFKGAVRVLRTKGL